MVSADKVSVIQDHTILFKVFGGKPNNTAATCM
jgi:hypothetical protein